MALIVFKEHVRRRMSLTSSIVAIDLPSGLGSEWDEAVTRYQHRYDSFHSGNLHLKGRENCMLRRK